MIAKFRSNFKRKLTKLFEYCDFTRTDEGERKDYILVDVYCNTVLSN
jgi:hypothetical protein